MITQFRGDGDLRFPCIGTGSGRVRSHATLATSHVSGLCFAYWPICVKYYNIQMSNELCKVTVHKILALNKQDIFIFPFRNFPSVIVAFVTDWVSGKLNVKLPFHIKSLRL